MAGPRIIRKKKKRKIVSNQPDKQNVDKVHEKRRLFKPYGLGGRGPL